MFISDLKTQEKQPTNLIALTEKKTKYGLTGFTAQIKVYYGYFIILSQCCDLAKREKGKPDISAFVASPLVDIPYGVSKDIDKLSKLKANRQDSFINFFYIPQHLPLVKDFVVDFNCLVSFPRSQYEFIRSQKVLQMTDKSRVTFKIKLGNHFARPTQEERDANIYP